MSNLWGAVQVDVMPESLPAVFSRLVMDKVGQFEKSLVVDIGGTTLDVGVIVGQFDSVCVFSYESCNEYIAHGIQ